MKTKINKTDTKQAMSPQHWHSPYGAFMPLLYLIIYFNSNEFVVSNK